MKKRSRPDELSPIFIGGIGGSGTRIIVKILEEAGVFSGSNLNRAHDNLYLYTITGKDPNRIHWPVHKLRPFIGIFHKLNFGMRLSLLELAILARQAYMSGRHKRIIRLVRQSMTNAVNPKDTQQWLAKFPECQFYLHHLKAFYPQCRYIHVMRNGLDMAFSQNTKQLSLFGSYFGVDINDQTTTWAAKQLRFWVVVNNHVLEQCQQLFPEDHMILRYDDLCQNPGPLIQSLLDFLQITPDIPVQQLAKLVNPVSMGRYRDKDLTQFSERDIEIVQALGFTCDTH